MTPLLNALRVYPVISPTPSRLMPACTACARVVSPVLPVAPKIAIFLTAMLRGPKYATREPNGCWACFLHFFNPRDGAEPCLRAPPQAPPLVWVKGRGQVDHASLWEEHKWAGLEPACVSSLPSTTLSDRLLDLETTPPSSGEGESGRSQRSCHSVPRLHAPATWDGQGWTGSHAHRALLAYAPSPRARGPRWPLH